MSKITGGGGCRHLLGEVWKPLGLPGEGAKEIGGWRAFHMGEHFDGISVPLRWEDGELAGACG